jgi:hypothetical protein
LVATRNIGKSIDDKMRSFYTNEKKIIHNTAINAENNNMTPTMTTLRGQGINLAREISPTVAFFMWASSSSCLPFRGLGFSRDTPRGALRGERVATNTFCEGHSSEKPIPGTYSISCIYDTTRPVGSDDDTMRRW